MPRPRSDIAPRILNSAREHFLRHGVAGASLRKIAEDAGTNIGMVYYYFPTKDDLFSAVLEDVYEDFLPEFSALFEADAPLAERLRRLSARVGESSEEEFAVMRIVAKEALVSTERLTRLIERFRRGHIPIVLQAVSRAVAEGELTSSVPTPVLIVAVASLMAVPQFIRRRAVASVPLLAQVLPSPRELAAVMVRVLLHGVAGPRASPLPPADGAEHEPDPTP